MLIGKNNVMEKSVGKISLSSSIPNVPYSLMIVSVTLVRFPVPGSSTVTEREEGANVSSP